MKAIILSAGQGRRLLPLTAARPKSALSVGPRTIIEWQLLEIAPCAVDEVVVVTGFGAEVIDAILARHHAVPTRTLFNPFHAQSDNLGSCWVARGEMTSDFVIINGDTLFEARILRRLLASAADAAVTLVTDSKASYDDDDMKVIVNDDRLLRVGKQIDRAQVNGESIGMMMFRGAGPGLFSAQIERMMRHGAGLKQWYLAAVDQLAQNGAVATCPIDGLRWCEIDTVEDLRHAIAAVADWYPPGAPVARSAR